MYGRAIASIMTGCAFCTIPCFFPEIAALTGDEGARQVVHRHRDALVRVTVDDAGVIEDFDTPD